jgi:hypothetical protein
MTQSVQELGIVLRLEFSIADAVHQRGLPAVLGTAILAWLKGPPKLPEIPAHLRADLGLLPDEGSPQWYDLPASRVIPDPLRRPGM